jgi:hypothetical protein
LNEKEPIDDLKQLTIKYFKNEIPVNNVHREIEILNLQCKNRTEERGKIKEIF